MNDFMQSIIQGSDVTKALFLLIVGVAFVFAVQMIFYIVIKIFTAKKAD